MASAISVPYSTLAEGFSLTVTDDGPTATVLYKVLWADMPQFIQDMKGTSTKSGTTAASITRTIPYAFPPDPRLHVTSIDSIEPHGPGFLWFGMLTRKWAKVQVRFGVLRYDFDGSRNGQPFTSVSFGVGGEFLTFPSTTYRFPDGSPTNTPIGRMISQIEIGVTRYQLPYLPVAEMAALAGKVNNAPYTIGNFAFPTGTLLLPGGDSQLEADSAGNLTDQVSYKFVYREVPWNLYMSPARSGAYQGFQAVTDSSGNGVYASGDYTLLP